MAQNNPPSIALSIRPVFAWLIVMGKKDIENRTWRTHYRGTFFVHASKKISLADYDWVKIHVPSVYPLIPSPDKLPAGGIVGQVDLVDCVTEHNSPWYIKDNYGFVLSNAQVLPFTPIRGQLGFFVPEPTASFSGQKLPKD